MNWYIDVLKKYAVFTGRARRSEYWFFSLFNIIILIVLQVLAGMMAAMESTAGAGLFGILYLAYFVGVLLPSLAVSVRRLHDTGRSGLWLLIGLVPLVGGIVLLIFFVGDSAAGNNQYGPNPKAAEA